jgi:hypothetical protein
MIKKYCRDCGKEIMTSTKYLKSRRRCAKCHKRYQSKKMSGNKNIAKQKEVKKKLSLKMQGEIGKKNRNWKGGRTIIKGYIYVYSPNHPYANSKKYYPLHRLIYEKYIKRLLRPEETVHHRDENKLNNKLSNLKLFPSRVEHRKYHVPKGVQIK